MSVCVRVMVVVFPVDEKDVPKAGQIVNPKKLVISTQCHGYTQCFVHQGPRIFSQGFFNSQRRHVSSKNVSALVCLLLSGIEKHTLSQNVVMNSDHSSWGHWSF